ncbi:MAG: hypothetical protein R6U61_01005 [Thermoplasmata archaeon]
MGLTEEMKEIAVFLYKIPFIKFLGISELTIIVLIGAHIFASSDYLLFIDYALLLLLLGITLLSSLMIVLLNFRFDGMGLLATMLILGGLSLFSFQIEGAYGLKKIQIVNIAFISSSILTIFLGIFLLKKKVGLISRRSSFFLAWIYSMIFFMYFPILELYYPRGGIGYGEVSSLAISLGVSLIAFLSLYRISKVKGMTNKFLEKGDVRRVIGDLEGAELNYKEALEYSESAVIKTRLGDLYFQKGELDRSIQMYNLCLGFIGDRNYRRGAICAHFLDQQDIALQLIEKAIKKEESPENLYVQGRIFSSLNEGVKEKESYKESLELDDDFWPSLEAVGDLKGEEEKNDYYIQALSSGGYQHSKRDLLLKIKGIGKFTPLFINPGDLNVWEMEEHDIVPEAIIPMIEEIMYLMNIDGPELWEKTYDILESRNDIDVLNKLEESDEVRLMRIVLECALGKEVDGDLIDEMGSNDHRNGAYYSMGISKGIQGKYDEALYHLKKINSRHFKTLSKAAEGCIRYMMGEYKAARDDLRTAIAIGYEGDDIKESISITLKKLGIKSLDHFYRHKKYEMPISLLITEKCDIFDVIELACYGYMNRSHRQLQILRNNYQNKYEMLNGLLVFFQGRYKNVIGTFNNLIEQDPEETDYLFIKGISLIGLGENEKALVELNKAIHQGGADPIYLFYRGVALYRLGRKKEAHDDFKSVYYERPSWEKNLFNLRLTRGLIK